MPAERGPAGQPDISVLICTHNHARFLPAALISVLAQSLPRDRYEIVVVDDGSTDDTREALAPFASDIRLIAQAHGGQAKAMNAAVAAARGPILCFLDAGDLWHPDKLRQVADTFRARPRAGLVQHWMADTPAQDMHLPLSAAIARILVSHQADLLEGRSVFTGTSGLSFQRDLVASLGPIPEGAFCCADEFLCAHVALLAPVITLDGFLGRRRVPRASWYAGTLAALRRLEDMAQARSVLDGALAGRMQSLGVRFSRKAQAARRWERRRERVRLLLAPVLPRLYIRLGRRGQSSAAPNSSAFCRAWNCFSA